MSGFRVVIKFHFCNDFVNHICVYVSESSTLGRLLGFLKTMEN